MAVEFIPIDRDIPYILPPSVQDYLPDDHLARNAQAGVDVKMHLIVEQHVTQHTNDSNQPGLYKR
ncbi:MAG TPA: hypothetical protein DCO71_08745 [Gammaproteobacteria bacterium]|nr:hypothetical protein [Gammaproteobacteria bacterium]